MPIPVVFRKGGTIMPTYQFTEIVSSTGYITFYAGTVSDDQVLSNNAFDSHDILTEATHSTAGTTLDLDFDVTVNRTITFRGEAIVNLPIGFYISNTKTANVTPTVKIRKWDGSSETDIVTKAGEQWSRTLDGHDYQMQCISLTVPLTTFKKGDILRVSVSFSVGAGDATTYWPYLAHDPKGRTANWEKSWDTSGATSSILTVQMPVRIDI